MKLINTKTLANFQKNAVHTLWNAEYPEHLNHASSIEFEHYLQHLGDPNHIVLANNNGEIKGWYFDFIRDSERWFAMILASEVHGKGYGTKLLNHAKKTHNQLNGWVIDHGNDTKKDGKPYRSPLDFYVKNDFKILSEERLEHNNISAVKIQWNYKN